MLSIGRLAITLVIILIGMVGYKKLSMPFKLLSIYLVYPFLEGIANPILIAANKNNLLLLHIEAFVYFLSFAFIYYYLLRNRNLKKGIVILVVIMIVFFAVNSLVLQPFDRMFPSNTMIANEIIFVILSLTLFKQMLLYPIQLNITKQGVFWLNTAVLFFSATMFLNFALINYYYRHDVKTPVLGYFWTGSEILFNILLGIALYTESRGITNQIDAKQ